MMGHGTFDASAYRTYSASTASLRTEEIYSSRGLHPDLNPHGVKVRESRDSADNPHSTPLIVALDVTGSMGMLADTIARQGLGTLFQSILDRKPISDPHIMFMGVGDANCDQAPLQVSQFEADNRIIGQLTNLWIEHGGGGNGFESYDLPWYFAAFHTAHDSIEKRGKRGYLFTVGDEEAPTAASRAQIKTILGDDLEANLDARAMLELAQRKYDVFHIIVEEGNHFRHAGKRVIQSWADLIGERLIRLKDHRALAETIVSAIEVAEGREADASTRAWGGGTARIVHEAVRHLPASRGPKRLGA
jgi:hypothetical protein